MGCAVAGSDRGGRDNDVHELPTVWMCSGAIARSGLGRVVFALSNDQLDSLKSGGGWPVVPQVGPALFDEARVVIDGYYS